MLSLSVVKPRAMNIRFLEISFLTICLIGCATAQSGHFDKVLWPESNLGKCYASIDALLVANFWPGYADDENIVQKVLAGNMGNKIYQWVYDSTPQLNVASRLVVVDQSGQACIILYSPSSSSIELKLNSNGALPDNAISINTPSAGFPATKINFKLGRDGIYTPLTCQLIHPGQRVEQIRCGDAFRTDK